MGKQKPAPQMAPLHGGVSVGLIGQVVTLSLDPQFVSKKMEWKEHLVGSVRRVHDC